MKNSKFYSNLVMEPEGIKGQRAVIMTRNTMRAQASIIQGIQKRLDTIDEKELNLTDLSPDNTYDLRPGGRNFTAEGWTNELQQIGVEKCEIEVELDVAKANFKKWFGMDYSDGLSDIAEKATDVKK